jgi:hypothetical protein
LALWTAALVIAAGAILTRVAWCGAPDTSPAPTVVLDSMSYWRTYQTARPPVAEVDGEIKAFEDPWPEWEKYSPPADWTSPDFDDHGWVQSMVRMTPYDVNMARLCLRGKFSVSDPAKVNGLKLSLAYQGGAIVYVNGKETARAHIAPGADLAEAYPPEAFLKDGTLAPRVGVWNARGIDRGDTVRLMRRRVLDNVEVPPGLLRTGVNVVAIEVVRAPHSKDVYEYKLKDGNDTRFRWPLCMLYEATLTAAQAEGLTPNARRPEGFQVWNQDLLASDFVIDWGDRTEPLRPVQITGARNGVFSGKLMVGADRAIRGLSVSVSDLQGAGGVIPASAIRVRYAVPWGENASLQSRSSMGRVDAELGCLVETPPEEIPLSQSQTSRALVDGAVTALWLTVQVPRDAVAGTYRGSLTVGAQDETPVTAALELKVADWTLSDPQDYRVWMEMLQSPDTLALEYETPLWSERHWDLIAQSFRLVSDSGSRIVYIPLIAQSNLGNAESMVRWIRKDDGSYEYDFSVMDRYLETAEKNLGPLKIVVFPAWEAYMAQKEDFQGRAYHKEFMEKQDRFAGSTGPVVTVLEKATGKTENAVLPRFEEPGSKEMWKGLFDQIRQRLAGRGLDGKMMVGMMNDACPSEQDIAFFVEVAPGVPWVLAAHGTYTKANFGYRAVVYSRAANEKSLTGWRQPELVAYFHRGNRLENADSATWRTIPAFAIAGSWRGVGRVGGDFWKVIRDKDGKRVARVPERYPQSNWRNLDIYTALLAPTEKGVAVTTRYEDLREGVQECEARVVVERAVTDEALRGKLGDDLAARCEKALEEHLRALQLLRGWTGKTVPHCLSSGTEMGVAWFLSSGWEERAERLFALAGEVERATGIPGTP